MGRSCRNKFLRLQRDCWRRALAVIPLRRIGGTTEDLRDLRIAKINTEGWMDDSRTSGSTRPRDWFIPKLTSFLQKSKSFLRGNRPKFQPPFLYVGAPH